MNTPVIIRGTLALRRRGNAHKPDATPTAQTTMACPRRVPRIARLMALARHVEQLVHSGTIASYAAAARLGCVSRARMSQILGLLNLAPDLQEQLLFLEHPARGRPTPVLRRVLTVAAALDWDEQRRRWRRLRRAAGQQAAVP
jgi:hypothetical protein